MQPASSAPTRPRPRALLWTSLAGIAGLALCTALVVYHGARDVTAIVAGAGSGIVVITVFHLSTLLAHSIAWQRLLPPAPRVRLRTLLWTRWLAESINDLLPVAQLGGNVVRAVLVSRVGVPGAAAGGSVVVDITTNLFAQLLFTLIGLAILLLAFQASASVPSVGVGLLLMSALGAGFYLVQRRGLFTVAARRIERMAWGGDWSALTVGAETLDTVVRDLYRDRRAITAATVWHVASWLLGAVEIWIALHFLGHPLSLLAVVALEAVAEAVRSAAFIVPAAIGVQEGGYVIVGAWLGLAGDVALAVSLAKRVREVLLGVPGLVVWQLRGVHALLRRRREQGGVR